MNLSIFTKNFLSLTRKDSYLLAISILLVFLENYSLISSEKSLINTSNTADGILSFKLAFSFIVTIYAFKFVYFIFMSFNPFSFLTKELNPINYSIGFGCFSLAILLIINSIYTNNTNDFLAFKFYKIVECGLSLILLIISSLADFSDDEKKQDDAKKNTIRID